MSAFESRQEEQFQEISKLFEDVPQLERGRVWCTVCGHSQEVDSANALQHGWPKHCGYTMTIDSPEERAKRGGNEK